MLIRQHVGIPVGQDELGALPAIKAASGVVGGAMASRRASARISSRRSSDSPPPPALPPPPPPPQGPSISADATVNQRNAVETRKRPAVAATGQNTRRHCRRRGAAVQSADVGEAAPVDMTKCDRCSAAFQTAEEMAAHVAAKCCADCSRDDAAAVPGQGPDGQGDVVDDPEEDVFDPTKHLCIYCTRQFTFVRALRRHVIETCAVRRELVENGEYIDEEWETQLTAMAGVGPVGGKQLTPGGTTDTGNDESIGNDGGRGGKRRRRCMNWTSSKSRSRRSARSSDDADDSLFGWEDAFLSTWGKDEREDITKREPLDTNATVSSTSFGAVKEERLPDQADGQSEPLQQLTSDIKLNMSSGDNTETLTSKAPVASEGAMTSDKAGSVQQATSGNLSSGMKQMTSDELDEGKENVKDPSLAVTSTPVSSERPTTTKNLDVSMSSDQDVTTLSSSAVDSDVTSAANSSVTSAGVDDSQADPDNDLEAAEESTEFVQKKSRKRRGHRLTVAKRKKN